ncbi:fasciclin-like arabinogalactan protein 7 [Lolium perenne]|uniref:fasciclin-like arabinogalactan protein 7 n=1 Tax=Lolium perenne TaxID=4522 RepID=UPI0021F673ED|nr:fasciclin-like arabinogalactan protein 7 [Lolium perenne]
MEFKAAVLVSTLLCLALSHGALSQRPRAPIVETPAPAPAPAYVDLAELLSLAGPYGTFLDYLTKTDVIKTFQSQANDTKQGISVFAPLDSAFAAVDSGALSNLTNDQLRSLMLHHAMPRYYPLSAFSKLAAASPVPMFAYKVNVTDHAGIIGVASGWATAKLVSSVYSTSPVAVYALDTVLLPKEVFPTAPEVTPVAAPAPAPGRGGKPMDDAPAAGGRGSKANVGDKGSSCRIGGGRLLVGYVVMMVCGFLMI